MALTLDSKLGDLLKDARVAAILDKHVPGATKDPQLSMGKGMALKSIIALPQAKQKGFTKEVVEKILAEANALEPA